MSKVGDFTFEVDQAEKSDIVVKIFLIVVNKNLLHQLELSLVRQQKVLVFDVEYIEKCLAGDDRFLWERVKRVYSIKEERQNIQFSQFFITKASLILQCLLF